MTFLQAAMRAVFYELAETGSLSQYPRATEGGLVIEGGAGEKTALFAPFIYKMHYFTKTGSGQT